MGCLQISQNAHVSKGQQVTDVIFTQIESNHGSKFKEPVIILRNIQAFRNIQVKLSQKLLHTDQIFTLSYKNKGLVWFPYNNVRLDKEVYSFS